MAHSAVLHRVTRGLQLLQVLEMLVGDVVDAVARSLPGDDRFPHPVMASAARSRLRIVSGGVPGRHALVAARAEREETLVLLVRERLLLLSAERGRAAIHPGSQERDGRGEENPLHLHRPDSRLASPGSRPMSNRIDAHPRPWFHGLV